MIEFFSTDLVWEDIKRVVGVDLTEWLGQLSTAFDQNREFIYSRKTGADIFVVKFPGRDDLDLIISHTSHPKRPGQRIWLIEKLTPHSQNKLTQLDSAERALLQFIGPLAVQ